ncbi:MAG: response regulator [Thermoanaerobaculales bacterium]|nr:response regulator [Thermoanaerobaculales bacterium]
MTTIRVLLVEDDPGLREGLVAILTAAGMTVDPAADGVEGWQLLETAPAPHDVVVTDRLMPRLDGMGLLRRIKQRRDLILLPVVILTVAAQPQEMVEGIDAGAYAYLTKPVDAEVLVSVIRSAAADWRHVQELNRHIRSDVETLDLLRRASFDYRSPDQAMGLGALLAKVCPDPDRVVTGLSELLVNAVEHGNLEIGYDEKSRLLRSQTWQSEVERRLTLPAFADRVASIEVERTADGVVFRIRDQGPGFEPAPYLEIDPSRMLDAHGRGIALARLLSFDDLHYEDGGRVAVATVRLGEE